MRRSRQYRLSIISIVFCICSVFNVYSENKNTIITSAGTAQPIIDSQTRWQPKTEVNSKTTTEPALETSHATNISKHELEVTSKPFETTRSTTRVLPSAHPTWRPRRTNCTPPAIEQFPRPILGLAIRKHGGLIVHFIIAIYSFIGLAIVCDEYFVSSLDRICEEMKLSPDVAGATFMAAGSSAPELATVIIGVFFAKDDIGISGVIGSAVFNIMFVIAVCGLCTSTVCYLNWWPLVRDCFFYSVSILVMLMTIFDDEITWGESLLMLIMYVVYCVALHFNTQLEAWAHTWPVPFHRPVTEETGLVSYKTLADNRATVTTYTQSPEKTYQQQESTFQGQLEYDPTKAWDMAEAGYNQPVVPEQQVSQDNPTTISPQNKAVENNVPVNATDSRQYYRPKEWNPAEYVSPLERPNDPSMIVQTLWKLQYPIHYLAMATMPNCKTEQYKNWYPFTFFMSMVWISFYSYFMVWMITIIGATLGIPDTVMGLTFVAAGVSVPDALSSMAVIKEGYGDMAVSNAVGSNVFDILICLGLPWFIQTAIIKPGSHVNVISKGLTYSTLSLLSTVAFLLITTHLNGWKLDRRYGMILMVWYLLFIVFASLYELNVFGQLNPPSCASDY